jgi:predicted transcriptional regulator
MQEVKVLKYKSAKEFWTLYFKTITLNLLPRVELNILAAIAEAGSNADIELIAMLSNVKVVTLRNYMVTLKRKGLVKIVGKKYQITRQLPKVGEFSITFNIIKDESKS